MKQADVLNNFIQQRLCISNGDTSQPARLPLCSGKPSRIMDHLNGRMHSAAKQLCVPPLLPPGPMWAQTRLFNLTDCFEVT